MHARVNSAEVAIVLIGASESPHTEQDLRVISVVIEAGRD